VVLYGVCVGGGEGGVDSSYLVLFGFVADSFLAFVILFQYEA
jgi:hypothetical protein